MGKPSLSQKGDQERLERNSSLQPGSILAIFNFVEGIDLGDGEVGSCLRCAQR